MCCFILIYFFVYPGEISFTGGPGREEERRNTSLQFTGYSYSAIQSAVLLSGGLSLSGVRC